MQSQAALQVWLAPYEAPIVAEFLLVNALTFAVLLASYELCVRHTWVGLMLNVRRADKEKILALLPALQRPTISELSDPEWLAINTIIEERTVRDLIPKLKAAGGQGIVEYPLNKIVL